MFSRSGAFLLALVLVVCAVVPFAAALRNQWVWDDQLLLGQRLQPEQLPGGFAQLWSEPYWGDAFPDTYRPLSLTVLYLEHRFFGSLTWPYRAVSLALHAAVCLLVLRLASLRLSAGPAWLCSLIFAVHPVHAEPVALAYGQLELLAALFVLLALDAGARPGRAAWAATLVFAFLACASKESALVLPVLAWLVWRSRRAAWLLLPAAVYLVLRWQALGGLLPAAGATLAGEYSALMRVKVSVVSLGEYLRLCLFPTGQSLYYGHLRDMLLGQPWAPVIWITGAACLFWLLARRISGPVLSFGLSWFFLGLLPALNIVPTGILVAERVLYLPLFGLAFLITAWWDRESAARPWLRFAPLPLLLVMAAASAITVTRWRDEETLWRSTIAAHPRSPMAHVWLGQQVLRQSHSPASLAEAGRCFQQALQLNPSLAPALRGQAFVAMLSGDCPAALRLAAEADRLSPDPAARAALQSCHSPLSSPPAPPVRPGARIE